MAIDFGILDGEQFELFCRDLLHSLGIKIIEHPSRGPDFQNIKFILYAGN